LGEAELKPGDTVRVVEGPLRGNVGTVKRVMHMALESESVAVVLVVFRDWGEDYLVWDSLEKIEDAHKGGKK